MRLIFESIVRTAMATGLVKGEGFAVDASVLEANASRYHGKPPEGSDARTPPTQHHATQRAARQCPEAQLKLAYRWFCGLGTEDKIPDHSAFTRTRALSQPRYFPFRLRARRRGVPQGGARRRPIDASLIAAEANKCRSTPGKAWSHDIDPTTAKRAVQDYLVNLDDLAWGAATDVVPKFVAPG